MTALRELKVEEVTGILSRGTFEELISTVEHGQFECKGGFYDAKVVKGKIELAKDVSSLANSQGGYLLIGPVTAKNSLHHSDEVVSVSEFDSSAFNPDTYRDILNAFIYPPITDLRIEWHPSIANPAKGIASIYVPPKSVNEKPFLVAQSELESQVRGHMFGYFERVGGNVLPKTVQMIRDRMKDSKRTDAVLPTILEEFRTEG
jgi:predicted HTH transcriptional regulator